MITISNCWKYRKEIIERCNNKTSAYCLVEILSNAKTEKAFKKIIIANFFLLNKYDILDYYFEIARDFKNGFAVVSIDRKFGYLNEKGDVAIPCIYDYAYSFNYKTNCATVKLNKEFFKINMKGERV